MACREAWSWLAKKLALPHRESFIKKDRLSACLPSRKPLSPSALLSARPWKLDFSSLSASPAHFGQGALRARHGRVSSVRRAPPARLSPWLFIQGLVINESSPREHGPVAAGPAPRCSRASSVKQKGAGQRGRGLLEGTAGRAPGGRTPTRMDAASRGVSPRSCLVVITSKACSRCFQPGEDMGWWLCTPGGSRRLFGVCLRPYRSLLLAGWSPYSDQPQHHVVAQPGDV